MTVPVTFPLDPTSVHHWSEVEALEALDRLSDRVRPSRFPVIPATSSGHALVVGDTHGDWPTARSRVNQGQIGEDRQSWFVALGDYVDRTPPELPQGSLLNALYFLSVQAAWPERVVLLQGNHEAQRRVPCSVVPAHMQEARELWGPSTSVGDRIQELFERLPLAAATENGAFFAHGGVPLPERGAWRQAIEMAGDEVLLDLLWNDLAGSPAAGRRGVDRVPLSNADVEDFFARSGLSVFLRGHDPSLAGQRSCHDRVLTLHTTRVYRQHGLFEAEVPLGPRLRDLATVTTRRFAPAPWS